MTDKILVSADALLDVLQALNGPHHLVLELQTIMRLPVTSSEKYNPIGKLMQEYKDWINNDKKNKDS